ncbi:hypothetical protein MMU07_21315 [Aquiflexum sp. LQ15W]|uniref:hypothetical protein n=1 Tax=Cognataquiflexum nitidum TaxID=2922272 RepID=UPI001F12928B|nr:hypothetical protein [Cognataquiflexum nitidum]MCH6202131.1 hypothetical protein [Cognataquiflexum nitidum]
MGLKDIISTVKEKIENVKDALTGDGAKDKFFASENEFPDEAIAEREFERSKRKLFSVNEWSNMPGITSSFQLYKSSGEIRFTNNPEKGDYILISLPGKLPDNWVKIIEIIDSTDSAEFTVSPSPQPKRTKLNRNEEEEETEHFFTGEATSTFMVKRDGKMIYGYEIGNDEVINNQGEEAAGRKWINTLIAAGGWLGFQKVQWEKLTDYLVHNLELESYKS